MSFGLYSEHSLYHCSMNQHNSNEIEKLCIQLFHNVLNPITVLSLEIDNQSNKTLTLQTEINAVIYHITKLEYFVSSISEHVSEQIFFKKFSVNQEIEQILEIISYISQQRNVHISSLLLHEVMFVGNQLKFHQFILQIFELLILASNPHEMVISREKERKIELTLEKKKREFFFTFSLENIGFEKEKMEKFHTLEKNFSSDLFFSTTLEKNKSILITFKIPRDRSL